MGRVGSLRILALGAGLGAPLSTGSGCFIFNHGRPDRAALFDVPASEFVLSVTNHNYQVHVQEQHVPRPVGGLDAG